LTRAFWKCKAQGGIPPGESIISEICSVFEYFSTSAVTNEIHTATHQWILVYDASRRRYGILWQCCCQATVRSWFCNTQPAFDAAVNFCRAMLCVCLSRSWILSKRINVFNFFSQSGSHTILVFFRTKRHGNIPTATPLTGASNAGGVGTNSNRRRYSWLSIDDVLDLRTTSATIHRPVYRTVGDASVKLYLSQTAAWTTTTKRREQNRTEFICTQG